MRWHGVRKYAVRDGSQDGGRGSATRTETGRELVKELVTAAYQGCGECKRRLLQQEEKERHKGQHCGRKIKEKLRVSVGMARVRGPGVLIRLERMTVMDDPAIGESVRMHERKTESNMQNERGQQQQGER